MYSSVFSPGRCFQGGEGLNCSSQPSQVPQKRICHPSALMSSGTLKHREPRRRPVGGNAVVGWLTGYGDQRGMLTTIRSLSEPKEVVRVGARMLETKGLERKGNSSISRISKVGCARRRRMEMIRCSWCCRRVETQEWSAESRVWWKMPCKGQWSHKYKSPEGCGTDGLRKMKAFLHKLGNCWFKCEEDLKEGAEQPRTVGYSSAGREGTDLAKRRRKNNNEGERDGINTLWVWKRGIREPTKREVGLKQIGVWPSQ